MTNKEQNKELFQWVKASERLPEKNGIFICKNNYDAVDKIYYNGNGEFYVSPIVAHKPEKRIDNVYEWLSPVTHLPPPESDVEKSVVLEDCRLYAENKMPYDWDRKDAEMVGVFYKFFIDKLFASQFTTQYPAKGYSVEDMEKCWDAAIDFAGYHYDRYYGTKEPPDKQTYINSLK